MRIIAMFFVSLIVVSTNITMAQTGITISNVTRLSASTAALGSAVVGGAVGGAIGVSLPISACPGDRFLITVDTTGAFNSKNVMTAQLKLDPTGGLGSIAGGLFGGIGGGLGGGLGGGFGLLPSSPAINIGATQPGGSPVDVIGGLFGGLLGSLTGALGGGGAGGGGLPTINTKTQTIIGTIPDDIANGTYTLRVVSSNPKDTSANYKSTISITRATKPTINLSCSGDSIRLRTTISLTSIGGTYLWSTGSTATSIKVPNSTKNYSLTVTNTAGCKATTDTLIKSNKIVKECNDQVMTLSSNVTAKNYLWSTLSVENSIELTNAQASGNLITLATLNPFTCAILNSPECEPIHHVTEPNTNPNHTSGSKYSGNEVGIPNVFTPNNDNVNDLLLFDNAEGNIKSVSIYNSWGIKVFETETMANAWNGNNRFGTECAAGTYYYVLEPIESAGNNIPKKGFFQLLR
jgi:gliding motility-associated-like protein